MAALTPSAGGGHPDQDGAAANDAVTVRVPLTFRKRGGRKVVMAPDGTVEAASLPPRVDITLVKALARAFRWRKLLETGVYATIQDIAAAEKIEPGSQLEASLVVPSEGRPHITLFINMSLEARRAPPSSSE